MRMSVSAALEPVPTAIIIIIHKKKEKKKKRSSYKLDHTSNIDAHRKTNQVSLDQRPPSQMALNPTPELNHAPVEGESEETSPENAIHTVMFRYGKGGYYTKSDDSQARRDHYRKARIGSVATHFRTNDEFMWYQFQTLNKSTMHGNSKLKVVNPTVAQHATPDIIQQQRRAVHQMLNASDADYTKHLDVDDSFSATVGKHVVGGKAYWHECFLKLIGKLFWKQPNLIWWSKIVWICIFC